MGILRGYLHTGQGDLSGPPDRPRAVLRGFVPGPVQDSVELVHPELCLLRLRRGLQGLPQKIRPPRRQAVLHSGHRVGPGKQPPQLFHGAALQHGPLGVDPQTKDRVLVPVARDRGHCRPRQEASAGSPLYFGCRRRGGLDGRIGEHPVSLCFLHRHRETPGRRCMSAQNKVQLIHSLLTYSAGKQLGNTNEHKTNN